MKVAILGSGGREHAIAWRLLKDESDLDVFVIPGNAGMSLSGKITCVPWSGDFKELESIVKEKKITFVIVGPETLLEKGVVDFLENIGVLCLGPNQYASQFESSKSFSKEFMNSFKIPTATSITVTDYDKGIVEIENWKDQYPPVVKASGLAAGKGVFVANTLDEAKEALFNIMINKDFPVSDSEVLLEQRLVGREVSSFALFDGNSFKVLGHSSDYKRLLDNDLGPNTGGMGTICDDTFPTSDTVKKISEEVFSRFNEGLKVRDIKFQGVLFAGLMISEDNTVNVIEFNVRFGDPETQSLLPCLRGNLLNNLINAAKGELENSDELVQKGSCVHVVMTTSGYPFLNDEPVKFGENIPVLSLIGDKVIFYSGVSFNENKLVNSGGRVLGISSLGDCLQSARTSVYDTLPLLNFSGASWRTDIGS